MTPEVSKRHFSTASEPVKLPLNQINQIRVDRDLQMRVSNPDATILEYAEIAKHAKAEGQPWPFQPVVVFDDKGTHWLADGFCRLAAAEQAEYLDIPVDLRPGTRWDAIQYAAGANAEHGLPRTAADKERAVMAVLARTESAEWSIRQIASVCKVEWHLADRIRKEFGPKPAFLTGRDGKRRPAIRPKPNCVRSAVDQEQAAAIEPRCGKPAPEPDRADECDSSTVAVSKVSPTVDPVCDHFQRPVPARVVPAFEAVTEFRSIIQALGTLGGRIKTLVQGDGGANVDHRLLQKHILAIDEIQRWLRFGAPYALCECGGAGCKPCRFLGWINESQYEGLTASQKDACRDGWKGDAWEPQAKAAWNRHRGTEGRLLPPSLWPHKPGGRSTPTTERSSAASVGQARER